MAVIAVDFDGTLCEHKFPEIGKIKEKHQKVINYIKTAKQNGATIILWTCREDLEERKYLTEAVEWCKENNIPIDFVNKYTVPGFNGFATRKVCADFYIDDKAVNIKEF
jgi:hydroxymethylpyrimidine pyrophosphatase-like HAD family hydrolase